MMVINKKMVVVVLLIIEFTCGYLMYQSSKKEVDLSKVTYEEEIKDSMFAMYVENEDTGEYDEVTNTNTFPEGYILNMDKTGCIDNKGNSISDILTSKDDKVMVKSNKTVFCYLYFDKDNRVYTQVKSDYKNNTGALLLSETESNEYPVYYYSGNITNNNILYANFCWKMVRTTETGGVKLIYNGIPDEAEDGTLTCDNAGEESQIGTSAFNSSSNSLAYVGYMYNTIYKSNSNSLTSEIFLFNRNYHTGKYYYGDTIIWDGTKYTLSNSDGSEVATYVWADNYTNLIGKYTCGNETATSCNEVYYVAGGSSGRMDSYKLTSGNDYNDYKLRLSTSFVDNGDGTYTLVNPVEIIRANWNTTFSNYSGYYYCGDLSLNSCSDLYFYNSANVYKVVGYKVSNHKYGNSATYENGVYSLKDTIEFWGFPSSNNLLSNNHYTCFNTTGECENIYYIYGEYNKALYYITLSNGKMIEDAINEMLYAKNVNTTDSVIKDYIDTWYENNIVNVFDSKNTLYSTYLEDTIWCNNREIKSLNGFDPNGGNISISPEFNYTALKCGNKSDQFTLKVEAGGTEDYGNNALDYPIGLLNWKEANIASSTGYASSGVNYWLNSPRHLVYRYMAANGLAFGNDGYIVVTSANAVRPAVSLSNKVEIIEGDGSVTLPYQVELSS